MGSIKRAYIFPHPPIIIPEVGKGNEAGAEKTIQAVKKAAEEIAEIRPTTIILTTPHGPVFQDYIYMSADNKLQGDLKGFGAGLKFEFENNTGLLERIITHANNEDIPAGGLDKDLMKKYKISNVLDHGALVPLYFINKGYKDFKLVHISIAGLPFIDLYKFGMSISRAVQESDEDVVFIASGDLSHRLSDDSPYGYDKHGDEFDSIIVESVKKLNIGRLLDLDENLCESAGECGLRSFLIMFGALDGYKLESNLYSYEGPFGIGYSVTRFDVGGKDDSSKVLERFMERSKERIDSLRKNESPYVELARKALQEYIRNERVIKAPEALPAEMIAGRAGTFVSIKKSGQLRGCIGTTSPTRKNIAEEIIHNAISSGTQDPRFFPVEENELDELVYSVDVLGEAEPIKSIDELDVIKYGVIVRSGARAGLLLPNLEGVDTPEKQVSIALQKAGIRADEKYSMERFEVVRYK